jgi:hypothetical protein
MFMVQLSEFDAEVKETERSNKLEKQKAAQFPAYTPYSVYGFHLKCMPSPLDFLRTFQIYSELISRADVGIKLEISEEKKGSNTIPDTAGGYLNFAGILLLAGSILSHIFGFLALYDEKRLKYLCCFHRYRKVFFQLVLTRMAVVSSFVLLLVLVTLLVAFISGKDIFHSHYFIFAALAILMLNLSLVTGAAFGALKNKATGINLLIAVLIFLLVFIPWTVNNIGKHVTLSISASQTEYDKLKPLMDFEKRGIEKFGNLREGDDFNKFIESYREDELKLLKDMENKHKQRLLEKADKYRLLAMLFPSTFYLATAAELSGKGINNYFAFYDNTEKKKIGFIKFYFQKEYFTKPKPKKVDSYLKGDDGIFYLEPSLPKYFFIGLLLQLVYFIVMGFMAYIKGSQKVHPLKQKFPAEEDMFIHITQSETNVLLTLEPLVKAKLYNHLSGKEKLKSQVDLVSGDEFESAWNSDFAYLPHPDTLEEIGPRVLHTYLFGKAPEVSMDTWQVMFKFALQHKLIVMDDFLKGMRPDKIKDILLKIEEKQLFCLIISSDYYFTNAIVKDRKSIYCLKNDPLFGLLKD